MSEEPDDEELPRGRDREHDGPARLNRVNLRLSADEHADIAVGARLAGLTPAGFCAQAALAAARGEVAPGPSEEREQLRQLGLALMAAVSALNRIGTNLNQVVTKLHSTDEVPAELARVVAMVERRAAAAGGVVKQIRRAMGPS